MAMISSSLEKTIGSLEAKKEVTWMVSPVEVGPKPSGPRPIEGKWENKTFAVDLEQPSPHARSGD